MPDLEKYINIQTPIGDVKIESESLKKFIQDCVDTSKQEDSLKYSDIYSFLGNKEINQEFKSLEPHKVESYLYCINAVINSNYEILDKTDYNTGDENRIPAVLKEFEYGDMGNDTYIIQGHLFLQHKETNSKIVISFNPYYSESGPHLEIEGYNLKGDVSLNEFWIVVEKYFDSNCPLRNKKIDTKWKFIKYNKTTWDDIIIEDDKKKLIDRNIINFIKNMDEYAKRRLPTSRGILLTGPPGTGKTLLCETIMNTLDCTTIYVSSDKVDKRGDISEVYSLAKRFSPSIVIIEDIDTLGGLDRRDGNTHPLFGEFLNCLNGVSSNEGVVTIATTNYPENLDLALTDRPGRFDLKIVMDLPNSKARKYILLKYLEEFDCEDLNIDKIVNNTDGLSGAYLREIVVTSYMISQERDIQINNKILQESADSIIEMKNNINPLQIKNSTLYQ